MEAGKKYRIIYRVPGINRVDRKGVAMFLGANKDALGRTELTFSGRPEFGTTTILSEYVSAKVEVPLDTQCYMDKQV